LPYLIDGDFKLTESSAIAKYIINLSGKTELLGKNVHDQGVIDNILGVINDILKEVRGLYFNPKY
jgi:glutathione S-transferase